MEGRPENGFGWKPYIHCCANKRKGYLAKINIPLCLLLILLSCSSGVQILRLDDNFVNSNIDDQTFIIVPKSGEWIGSGTYLEYSRFPETERIIDIFSEELSKTHPCVDIISPEQALRLYPDIEDEMSKREWSFDNVTKDDSTFFNNVHGLTMANYLIYFERIGIMATQGAVFYRPIPGHKESDIIVQIWDLQNIKLVARLISEGHSSDAFGLFRGSSSEAAFRDAFKKIMKQIPKCNKQ